MRPETLELVFPVGGLHRGLAYQKQPPHTTPSALNVRAKEASEGRVRGGSRPGLVKAFSQQLGSGSPIRLLNSVREIAPTGGTIITDTFASGDEVTDNSIWSTASWKTEDPAIRDGYAYGSFDLPNPGVVLSALSPTMNVTTAAYTVTLELKQVPANESPSENSVELYLRMNDTTPVGTTDGVVIKAQAANAGGGSTPFSYSLYLYVYSAGVLVETYNDSHSMASPAGASPTTLSVVVNETGAAADRIHVRWTQGTTLDVEIDQTITTAAVGQRIGFGIINPSTSEVQIDSFSLNYTPTGAAGSFNRNRIVAASATTLYEEDNSGNMFATAATFTAQTQPLQSVERLGWLYVADVAAEKLMVYKPEANSYTEVTATAGTVPTKCSLITLFRDCIVLANQSTSGLPATAPSPHMWYMSKAGTPTAWDFSQEGPDEAVAGTNSELAGIMPVPITALFSFTDDYLIFGSHRSIYVMRGHPRIGGYIDILSKSAGIIDANAWCAGPSNVVYFLAHDGMYSLVSGEQGYAGGIGVIPLSKDKLPQELQRINTTTNSVLMAYDVEEYGVHVFITPSSAGTGAGHWFYDIANNAFWPVKVPATMEPTSIVYYKSDDPTKAAVLLGCRDGYIRKFSNSMYTDDGTDIENFLMYGPIAISKAGQRGLGMLTAVVGTLDTNSGDVTMTCHADESPQGALTADSGYESEWSGGLNYTDRPCLSGSAAFVKLTGQSATNWAVDSIYVDREQLGAQRK